MIELRTVGALLRIRYTEETLISLTWSCTHMSLKMNTPIKPPRYSADQIKEIIDRILTLRMRWLAVVETQLASRKTLPSLDSPPIAVQ